MRDSGMIEGEKLRSLHEQKLFLKGKDYDQVCALYREEVKRLKLLC